MVDASQDSTRSRRLAEARTALLAFLLLVLGVAGCSGEEAPVKVDLDIREEVNMRLDPEAVTYAYLPQFSHTVSFQRHHLLVRYLAGATGRAFRQVFPDTFDEHMRMVGQGKIDISFSNPFVYIQMSERYGALPLARVVEANGKAFFRGEIVCRADNAEIRRITDVRGKRLIAVDPGSAGGYLYPMGYLMENGIHPADFAEIAFAPGPGGKQEKVVLAVHAGRYDVGMIREGALQVVADNINPEDIRVVARTPWFPGWMFAASRGLEAALVDQVRDALVALDPQRPKDREILAAARIARIIPAADTDFESVRRLWWEIGAFADLSGVVRGDGAMEAPP